MVRSGQCAPRLIAVGRDGQEHQITARKQSSTRGCVECDFRVGPREDNVRHVRGVTYEAIIEWEHESPPPSPASAVMDGLLRTGFTYIINCLHEGTPIEPEFTYLAANKSPLIDAAARRPCEHQRDRGILGTVCAIAEDSGVQGPTTNEDRCNKCVFPEQFMRCRHLRGQMVVEAPGQGPGFHFGPACHKGRDLTSPEECLKRACFEPLVVGPQPMLTGVTEEPPMPSECPFSSARLCKALEDPDPSLVFIAGSANSELKKHIDSVESAVRKAGMKPYFATNELVFSLGQDAPCEKICRQIRRCALVILLLTAPKHEEHLDVLLHSPNVYYEFGLVKAFGKRTIPLLESDQRGKLPFDVQHLDVRFYTMDGLPEIVADILTASPRSSNL